MVQLRRGPQTVRQQRGELPVFALLGAIRIAMLWFADALEGLKGRLGTDLSQVEARFGVRLRAPLLGVWVIANLLAPFAKINLLMLSDTAEPNLLPGQVMTYPLFFVLAWGWIFWRLDRVAGDADQRIVEMPGAATNGGSFDDHDYSLMSILDARRMFRIHGHQSPGNIACGFAFSHGVESGGHCLGALLSTGAKVDLGQGGTDAEADTEMARNGQSYGFRI